MNKIRRIYLMIMALLLLALKPLPCDFKEIDISELIELFNTERITTILETVKHIHSPVILSEWNVKQISDPKCRSYFELGRSFGYSLSMRLEDWAATMQQKKSVQENVEYSRMLLDLSDWITSQKGYGNFLLGNRCLDIACVGLGRAIADLEYPLDEIEQLMLRLDPDWNLPKIRALILNKESGSSVFDLSTNDIKKGNEFLRSHWKKLEFLDTKQKAGKDGINIAEHIESEYAGNKREIEEMKSARKHEFTDKLEAWYQEMLYFLSDDAELDSNLEFYRVSKAPRTDLYTLSNTWDSNQYGKLVYGLNVPNISKVKALLTYRKTVGEFPEKLNYSEEFLKRREESIKRHKERGIVIVPFEDNYETETEAAFDKAWDPYCTNENQFIDNIAAKTYLAIQENRFYDEDTKQKKAYEKRQQLKQGAVDSSSDAGS